MQKISPSIPSRWLSRNDNQNTAGLYGMPSPREQSREDAIRGWVGEEAAPKVFSNLRPPPKHIREVLETIQARVDVEDIRLLKELQERWPELVGRENAKFIMPVRIAESHLLVEVLNSTMLYVLNQQLPILNRRLSDLTGGKLTRIRSVAAGSQSSRT